MHAAVDQCAAHGHLKEQIVPLIDIRAAGLNHFSWILSIRDRKTGEDLYPLFRKRFFELDPQFEPLTRDVFSAFELFPVPGRYAPVRIPALGFRPADQAMGAL